MTTTNHENTPLLEVAHVHKTYFMDGVDVRALRGVSLRIENGEFVAIMGASGSGKSTLMNILGCLDRPTKGHYLIEGRDVSKLTKDQLAEVRNSKIGFVFQGFNLLSRTSALENVELPMIYAGVSSEARLKTATEALASVGLQGREQHHSSQLSGGQQQRVAIARSLVNKPALILADEPTGNLDSRSSVEIMGIFQELNRSGITIILITHEAEMAAFSRRRITVRDGLIVADLVNDKPLDARSVLASMPRLSEIEPDDENGGSE